MAINIAPSTGPSPSPKTSASPPPLSESISSSAVRSPSPPPPPASPLTPPAQPAKLAAPTHTHTLPTQPPPPPAHFIEQPPSLPFSSHESSDAIALRAAISSLQFQRLQAQRDLRTLEDIKRQAIERPEEYRQHVIATAQAKLSPPPWAIKDTSDRDMEDDEDDVVPGASSVTGQDPSSTQRASATKPYPTSYGSMLSSRPVERSSQSSGFPAIPLPQAVVRCPPIEWAKYNIVGKSLDKLHLDQQTRPGDDASSQRDSVVAAPYNPFLDKLDSRPVQEATTSTRKDSGSSASDRNSHRRPSKSAT
ncbi:hypothetical protein AUEXF2481DRAFT_4245 [Aureobasidium subglaciale EXF-2481]|uniref:Uncharacterized protein n=1 Tax=Aureobasidium subglaciale (strain EXF-2481) TaxID=1043005 RepID=A0A074YE07_AURSE|nr:uncharacterized protein AUEXF2481DRAFT_4245 [Aureobasidium subglaciale EXF-2481]KAI5210943.1 hypothetical protein E4T38_01602 [Aureobasidium subglaciale]KAI5219122.1 hypothetical protein E4T40_06547 [Aureobasidium subglaciale]KAI5233268.1 hypothetical protein E4T41_01600 [Aureobasidium subglaciale]KAI5260099.1 hypothetical protein E4T46_06347 [Aureobasidium subglaciale]KEQ95985.1 hypothetical protein AUEXF2481DRAFT_4245 [Aureobasidium subglaciale EXF-2481]